MSFFRVIEGDPDYPVQPDDIDCDQSFHWAFPDLVDGPVAHAAAKAVIRHCQQAGGWTSFVPEDLPSPLGPLVENGYVWKQGELVPLSGGWIVRGEDGRYRVVTDFILRCFGRAQRHR